AAGDEMLEMLDLLIGTSELTAAAGDRAFLPGCGGVTNNRRVQEARTAAGKFVWLCILRPLLHNDFEHLRDDVAGALDANRVADAHIEPLDLVGIVQRCVLNHDA